MPGSALVQFIVFEIYGKRSRINFHASSPPMVFPRRSSLVVGWNSILDENRDGRQRTCRQPSGFQVQFREALLSASPAVATAAAGASATVEPTAAVSVTSSESITSTLKIASVLWTR